MDETLKKRMIGAAVLASLAVIFVPMLVEAPEERAPRERLPEPPPARPFESALLAEPVRAPEPPPEPPRAPEAEAAPPPAPARQTAESTPAPATRTGLPAWVVQAGSFSSEENARRLVDRLRAAGLQTLDPEPVEIRGKRLWRVQVGPLLSREEAQALRARVDRVSGTRSKVRAWP